MYFCLFRKGIEKTMEQQDRIMDGDLQTLGLQSILKMLALSGKTGTLFVHSGPETLSISLRKGQIVALREEGVPQPDLLGMLCLVNKLDPPRAAAVREAARGSPQVALAILVENNWMSAAEMQQRLEFAVTQSVSHALRWVDGRFSFHRHLVPMEGKMQPLDIDSVLLEALRQADEWEEMGDPHLTRTEFDLLRELMLYAGKVLTHRSLLRAVWGPEYGQEADYLRVYVRQLRLKVEAEPSRPRYILTEPGIGYVFRSNELQNI